MTACVDPLVLTGSAPFQELPIAQQAVGVQVTAQ